MLCFFLLESKVATPVSEGEKHPPIFWKDNKKIVPSENGSYISIFCKKVVTKLQPFGSSK